MGNIAPKKLKSYRKRLRISQRELAGAIGVFRERVGEWEIGKPKTRPPINRLACILGINEEELKP